jgi:hypothetical protein
LALFAAGLTGGGVMMATFGIIDVIWAMCVPDSSGLGGGFVAIVAFPFWLLGAFVVGPPLWVVAHFAGLRSRRAAIAVGVVTAPLAVLLVLGALEGEWRWPPDLRAAANLAGLAAVAAFSGGFAGAALHHVAYRTGEGSDAR